MLKIALVGRPNVGKSSIFNRLVGKKQAITTEVPGTTRDWNTQNASYKGRSFCIIDTAGVEKKAKQDELKTKVKDKFEENMASVDLVLFVCDASVGITEEDLKISKYLKKLKKEVILIVNKSDLLKNKSEVSEFYKLGFDEPVEVSALRTDGTEKLFDIIWEKAEEENESEFSENSMDNEIRVSIVGRPNVGKSSFLNKLIDEEKFIVSDVPGTTRDVNSTIVEYKDESINFLDTAGLRRRGKIGKIPGKKSREGIVEKFSADRTKEALEESDISILLLDAADGITSQDLHVAGFTKDAGNGVIIVVNKWDLAKEDALGHRWNDVDKFTQLAKHKFEFLPYAPIIFVSSITGKNVSKVLDLIIETKKRRETRIPTSELNDFLNKIILKKPPVSVDRHQVNIKYVTQADINPPTFVFFANYPEKVHFSYKRYLENRIRENWDFAGTPIRINFRAKSKK